MTLEISKKPPFLLKNLYIFFTFGCLKSFFWYEKFISFLYMVPNSFFTYRLSKENFLTPPLLIEWYWKDMSMFSIQFTVFDHETFFFTKQLLFLFFFKKETKEQYLICLGRSNFFPFKFYSFFSGLNSIFLFLKNKKKKLHFFPQFLCFFSFLFRNMFLKNNFCNIHHHPNQTHFNCFMLQWNTKSVQKIIYVKHAPL